MTLEKFNEQKAKFHEQEKVVNNAKAELNKAEAILEALKNEREQFIHAQKAKLADIGTISADEYVELKNKDSGLQARIEYYQALIVDLEKLVEQEQEKLYSMQTRLKHIRGIILKNSAEELFNSLLQENKEKFSLLYTYLANSGEFEFNPHVSEKTKEEQILHYMSEKILKNIAKDKPLDDELNIKSDALANFVHKTPAQQHKASFNTEKVGIASLIHNL